MPRKTVSMPIVVYLIITLTGCLDFGNDIETSSPTLEQITRCINLMSLNPEIQIDPLGFKMLGSGIDDAVWFKYKTRVADMAELFKSEVVQTDAFSKDYVMDYDDVATWWDTNGKKLLGGQINLPNARIMNVGIDQQSNGDSIIYIMWHET